jgi:crotonobetainyl-CoA:carnitine CoA-transferase CaiB-like acyl-CoA transferase
MCPSGGRANVVPWGIFERSDGQLRFACGDDGQWQRLVELMGDPEWGHDELFNDRESPGKGTKQHSITPLLEIAVLNPSLRSSSGSAC